MSVRFVAILRLCVAGLATAALLSSVGTSNVVAQADLFAGNDRERWASFQTGPCTLVEGVPIVKGQPDVAPVNAGMSSIIGYHERQLPILGPPVAGRIEGLVSQPVPGLKPLRAGEKSVLTRKLYELQDTNFRAFLETANSHPNQTDGAIRSYILQQQQAKGVEDLISGITQKQFQTVGFEKRPLTSRASFNDMVAPLKAAADTKKLALLVARDSGSTFVSVGYASGGELLIVIDPSSAESRFVPAEQVLLPDEDRKSSDEWSRRVREIAANRTEPVDGVTSCKGNLPPGVRFLNPARMRDRVDAYIVHSWTLSGTALRRMFEGQ